MSDLNKGLALILKIDPEAEIISEHDQMYVHPQKKITDPELIKQLEELNWVRDSASETCWSCFC